MACELRRRKLDFLKGFSLGEICHIVQLGITSQNLVAYEANELKPVAACVARRHALMCIPQSARHADELPHIQSVEQFVECLDVLLPNKGDTVLLAVLKRKLR